MSNKPLQLDILTTKLNHYLLQEHKTLTVTTPKKEGNMWYDVGIIKGTSCLVSYYHLPAEGKGNGDVQDKKVRLLL